MKIVVNYFYFLPGSGPKGSLKVFEGPSPTW